MAMLNHDQKCGYSVSTLAVMPSRCSRVLKNPPTPRLLKKVQMQGGARRAE
jgi:hypothetical protein